MRGSYPKFRVIALALCCALLFSLCGCGGKKSNAKNETEKELVGLLRDYNATYEWYADYTESTKYALLTEGDITISFVLDGDTILTDEHITLIRVGEDETGDYYVEITFDEIGAAIFADITANNIGECIVIEKTQNGKSSIIAAPYIGSAITGNCVQINNTGRTKEEANDLFVRLTGQAAEKNVKRTAAAYNDKMAETLAEVSLPEYLPASLAVEPPFTDVSEYLIKAEAAGFIE